ncbi:type I-F CRISPR-associated protein Csy1 [Moraxella catarrhalis]|uniref:type I-F CRISPR-associated protein Csy1 n=1 Tax=Moraxella catarrhalis TaxID=480 RepID=UPI000202A2F7|nr:type I-F CRISPR-associated protein Csy1 [Moraxella catarrhalis]EGE24487.1 CRISPR-associated protein, Csy1 family [Moraxella catarrhalis CO72]EGE25422.1 CRISPR-associated protein, Csy1 family [Moraxella catarrhalis 101P30B1]MPX08334.1 type I-F CRISPR-associated protein Csy1 [Moraxella catarrhalis]MPX16393.1 type I-F CRISPR-associated protein Csy1 [Moraxella catarrhalis]MPX52343.1 type I-F CRISPR-associated protein Csy1 [Moraxella catarrhalis]
MLESIQEIDKAIKGFLQTELDIAIDRELKKKTQTQKNNLSEQNLNKKRDGLYDKLKSDYESTCWLAEVFNSIQEMQNHQLSFATHTAKGIHTALKTENVISISNTKLPVGLVGSQSIPHLMIDANSNNPGSHSGYLKYIIGFINVEVNGVRIYELIQSENVVMMEFFKKHQQESGFDYLNKLLLKKPLGEQTDGKNKQLLFYQQDGNYTCLIPLYPTSITHYVYQKISNVKYSEVNLQARKNRRENKDPAPYCDMPNLAVTILGGTNSNNVSRLNNIQGGRNYLLPSLPPKISQDREFSLSKFCENFFESKTLKYHIQDDFNYVVQVVKDTRNTIDVRDKRKDAIDRLLHTIFGIAHVLQNKPAGWSKTYALPLAQKIWLDPYRADLDGEAKFADEKTKQEWQKIILQDFASWFNQQLRSTVKELKFDFADAEYNEWQREIEEMQKFYERLGKGVFL